MDKVKCLRKFLFDKSVSAEQRKERIRLAYFTWEAMDELTFKMRKKTINHLIDKIKNSKEFSDYKIIDKGLTKGISNRPLCIFKEEWCYEDGNPLIYYALETLYPKILSLLIGIKKYSSELPFKGNWRTHFCCSLPIEVISTLCKLYNTLLSSNTWCEVGETSWWWKSEWEVAGFGLSDWDQWIAWQLFHPRYRMNFKAFYLEIINKGYDLVADYYLTVLKCLKKATEPFIDQLIKIYKQGGTRNV